MIEHDNCRVEITQSRWSVKVRIVCDDDSIETYVASADSGLTWGDGIFFGTAEEYAEAAEGAL